MKQRPSHEKRRKEQARKTRQQDKAERRAARKLGRGETSDDQGLSPDDLQNAAVVRNDDGSTVADELERVKTSELAGASH